jgi:putative sterol carrier protein
MTELEKFFTKLNDNLDAEKAGDINATFCFKIGGDDGGTWVADLTRREDPWVSKVDGDIEGDCTFITKNAKDWIMIGTGKMNGMVAMVRGKLKFEGDDKVGMKIMAFFPKNLD